VALAAKLAEVPLEDFKALNPSASRPVILAAGTPQILLPWDNAKIFESNLETYAGGQLASWTVWLAPSTMKPATAAKQVGMTEAELRSVNHIPPRVLIKAGSSLLVPRSKTHTVDVTEHVADNGQMSLTPEAIAKRKASRAVRQALAQSKSKARPSAKVRTRATAQHAKKGLAKATRVAKK
jgi:membrane-bound lytic murein transglycosylase D